MARKNLLQGLMDEAPSARDDAPSHQSRGAPENRAASPAPLATSKNRTPKGAIGAVSQSIAALKARALVDLDTDLIDDGGMADRLDVDQTAHAELTASIRDYGQQVPVLVRPHPEAEGRYQIVYGRRRLMALRELGQPVKALIRDLDDRAAVLAQGQENSARRDLTFIEKANFARQLRDAGYDRKVVCDALNVDKTLISRMLSVADRVPGSVIEAVGSAPSFGRDRWLALADLIVERDWDEAAICASAVGNTSDKRAEALHDALTLPDRRRKEAEKAVAAVGVERTMRTASGRTLGEARVTRGKAILTFREKDSAGFETWLIDNIEEIHRGWMKSSGGE